MIWTKTADSSVAKPNHCPLKETSPDGVLARMKGMRDSTRTPCTERAAATARRVTMPSLIATARAAAK